MIILSFLNAIGIYLEAKSKLQKLDTLYLRHMVELDVDVNDITPLKELSRLTNLDLSHNRICDTSPLKDLLGLVNLNLAHNYIEDIEPFHYKVESVILPDINTFLKSYSLYLQKAIP